MVPCQLELGGKDPLYISMDNSDIQRAAALAAEGAFYNNGQSCCAVERIYVHQKVYSEFVEAFLLEVGEFRVGDPLDQRTFIGPLARPAQLQFLDDQIEDAVAKGAKVMAGGKRLDGTGYYFAPTVMIDVDHNMSIMKYETFGPAIGIQKVQDDEEALE